MCCLGLRDGAVQHPIGLDQPTMEPRVFSTAEVRKNSKVYLDHRIATRGTRDVRGLWKLSVWGVSSGWEATYMEGGGRTWNTSHSLGPKLMVL